MWFFHDPSGEQWEHYFYWVLLASIAVLAASTRTTAPAMSVRDVPRPAGRRKYVVFFAFAGSLIVMTWISVSIHSGLFGAKTRF